MISSDSPKDGSPRDRWGFVSLAVYRGALQFGLLASALFIILGVLRGDSNLLLHAFRAIVAFPIAGFVLGAAVWFANRIIARARSPR